MKLYGFAGHDALLLCSLVLLYIGLADCLEICSTYPTPDPCLPGGVWDPAVQSCTGYGGMPCFQCYYGPFCKEWENALTCKLKATVGNPLLHVEYWMNNGTVGDPCTSTLGHYRPSYQLNDEGEEREFFLLPPLLEAIRVLHRNTGNAKFDGYHLVAGVGATMVLNVAVAALSKKILASCTRDCPEKVDVFAQRPYYTGYAHMLDLPTAQWNPDADPLSPWTIEFNTYPNNPNGAKRTPLVTDSDRIITDMVYYWPMYTDIDREMSESIMIFSSSKHDGLAGTRFGWALVKDPKLARDMWSVSSAIMYTVPVDIELRILTSMQSILSEGQGPDGLYPFHKFGREKIYSRISKLRSVLSGCPQLELQNPVASPGSFAWIHCSGERTCEEIFDEVNLYGDSGEKSGTTAQDVRFSLLLPTVEFNTFLEKFLVLCSEKHNN